MGLPVEIDFNVNKSASPARMNLAMASLDARLRALEGPAKTFDQTLAQVQSIGLQRINEVIKPIYDEAVALTSLGAIFTATSASALQIALGMAAFLIDPAQLPSFAFSQWMSAMNGDASAAMSGRITSFDRATGILVMNVLETYGAGTFTSWIISPSSPPLLTAAVVDAGTYDGSNVSTNVPYTFTPTTPAADGGSY